MTGHISSHEAAQTRTDPDGDGRLPNFLIIGAMKSGTSSLGRALAAHPQAFCLKEPHFFCEQFGKGIAWYRKQFLPAVDRRAVGDKCPDYMYMPQAMRRLAEVIPTARLIVLLRNPIDRAYSNYWHERRVQRETLSFVDALDAEEQRLDRRAFQFAYTDMGRYHRQLEGVASLFPRESIHVGFFEDFRTDPGQAFASVCRFLAIDDSVRPPILNTPVNPYRKQRLRKTTRFLKKHNVFQRLPRPVSRGLKKVLVSEASYPPLEPEIRRRLEVLFAKDNAALASWLNRELPWSDTSS